MAQVQLPEKLAFLFKPNRYKVAYGGRGAAKSWGFARALLIQGAQTPLRILCTREIQNSIQDSVHRLLADQVVALGLEQFYVVQQASIVGRNGTEFLFTGLRQQDIAKIKSFEGVDRCWVEEAQPVTKKSWEMLIPTIRKPGSEIWVSFNPDLDTDETYLRWVVSPPEGAAVVPVNYHDNPWFPPELERERLHLLKVDPDAYENVWEGRCKSSVDGAIYKREIDQLNREQRLRPVPHDPSFKVHTVWDLGFNDAMSIILAQRSGPQICVIDYIEDNGRTLADYVADLKTRSYNWGTDYLPHDGVAKDFKSGKSAQQILNGLGRSVQIIPRLDIESGIRAARMLFPRVYFDSQKAVRLVDCLKRYRRGIPATTNEPGHPLHDEYSHGADAFRYLALVADGMTNEEWGGKLKYPSMGHA